MAGPAHASTYDTALAVMQEVKSENRYVNYSAKDFTPINKGERGNCARFAATYAERMNRQCLESHILTANVKGAGPHAIAITAEGWVMNNMRAAPLRFGSVRKPSREIETARRILSADHLPSPSP